MIKKKWRLITLIFVLCCFMATGSDVKTGKVLHRFDRLTYAEGTGPGGNLKIGYYEYGIDYPGFGVTEDSGVCTMITPDVITIDLEHKAQGTTPYSYTCYRNTHEAINGGYCPLNDAQYYGQAAYDMYKNWYGVILSFSPLRLRCHYKKNYDGAFWDGLTLTINKQGKNYRSTAVVTIWDTNNAPVANAAVFITWSGVVSGSDSGITGPDGTVTFESPPVKSTGPFTITVDNVTHAALPYNPALNNETSDSASY
ncbi:MAG: hypothetical protein GTO45_40510 [Candidatus Aminicenantes bacterium]|nr:hypothetical protein [Candidatus Aminicenantes bacterium]NIM84889.1 hypothetical protein [Candidatus Aminicenantes bacterium]NIN24400.1 hypothetical protein [Candidatus Aminicenantes bacterium]NIN48164.1 hypothetical protein [Candidatus Aminicenantes bacterium]NIN91067.1 hypothetical protein [Candidatus Aminicenantes bacterium]